MVAIVVAIPGMVLGETIIQSVQKQVEDGGVERIGLLLFCRVEVAPICQQVLSLHVIDDSTRNNQPCANRCCFVELSISITKLVCGAEYASLAVTKTVCAPREKNFFGQSSGLIRIGCSFRELRAGFHQCGVESIPRSHHCRSAGGLCIRT